MWKEFLKGLGDLFYPHNCLLCHRFTPPLEQPMQLCFSCQNSILMNKPPFCIKCTRPLRVMEAGSLCTMCQQTPPVFDFAWGACLYTPHLRDLIHLFKYRHKTSLRFFFSQRIFDFIEQYRFDIKQFDWIMAIPLHATRFRERGYNQTQFLAEALAHAFQIPLSTQNLIRVRHTHPQSSLNPKERWTNIQGAFRINRLETFKGASVLILDDLLTTGATVNEAARVLKEAKTEIIGVLTLAITT